MASPFFVIIFPSFSFLYAIIITLFLSIVTSSIQNTKIVIAGKWWNFRKRPSNMGENSPSFLKTPTVHGRFFETLCTIMEKAHLAQTRGRVNSNKSDMPATGIRRTGFVPTMNARKILKENVVRDEQNVT